MPAPKGKEPVEAKAQAASAKASDTSGTPPRNEAQAEFDRFKAKTGTSARTVGMAAGGGPGAGSGAGGAASGPFGYAPGTPWGGPIPGWPYPPSVAVLPAQPWPGHVGLGQVPAVEGTLGSLTERLRYTVRLGVDVLNAGLAGGLSVLGGLPGVTERLAGRVWGDPWHHGEPCCCGQHHGYAYDCCCHGSCWSCCECESECGCQPSVGTCCR